jgi:hypothetical protein
MKMMNWKLAYWADGNELVYPFKAATFEEAAKLAIVYMKSYNIFRSEWKLQAANAVSLMVEVV